MDEGTLIQTKEMLDDMNKRKIDMADEIFVINIGSYIGTSTRSEIEYASATGKGVRYLEPIVQGKKEVNSSSIKLLKDYYIYIPEDAEVFAAKGRKVAIIYRRFPEDVRWDNWEFYNSRR